ncbi:MAG TPA: M56 family metallopeptidase, partial [Gemmatimonadaceae bacterium]|nr:M56 family metallopeptidase [Gemmatimonadaceae bacterium]
MSIGFLLYVALVITLAAVVGWAAESLCREYGRATRWAWLAASGIALVLVARAVTSSSANAATVTYSRIALPAASKVAAPEWSLLQLLRDAISISATAVHVVTDSIVRAVPSGMTSLAVFFWIATSLLALVVLTFVHLRIRRARREWAEADLFGTRVRIAPDVGPAVVGVMRPQIVVPSWLLSRSDGEQQLVLAHECEHLRARDHLLLGAGSLVVALVPWHPAAWWMLSRLRLAIELDCDARVLRRG